MCDARSRLGMLDGAAIALWWEAWIAARRGIHALGISVKGVMILPDARRIVPA